MASFFYDKIGEYFGREDANCPCGEDLPDFEPGLLVDSGVAWVTLFDKLLIPEEIRKTRSKCKSPCCGRIPICPPTTQKARRPSCYKNPFPKSSCS
ncbi:hypothetical protein HHI36_005115 [Cryptolaemus montrouzieri]|uniref:Uncharacterized protein n=1 Tax=Cryptolaemus montrouzieri TaxID=559131 RepID=A0ABD2NTF0_9CUCU